MVKRGQDRVGFSGLQPALLHILIYLFIWLVGSVVCGSVPIPWVPEMLALQPKGLEGRPPSRLCSFLREAGSVSRTLGAGGSPRAMKHTLGLLYGRARRTLSRAVHPGRRSRPQLGSQHALHVSPPALDCPVPSLAGRVCRLLVPAAHTGSGRSWAGAADGCDMMGFQARPLNVPGSQEAGKKTPCHS